MRDSSPPKASDPAETVAVEIVSVTLHDTLATLFRAGNKGATYEAVGARCGVPKQHVGEWCNALSGRTPRLAKIVRMGATIAPAVLRALAARVETEGGRRIDLRDAALGMQESAGRLARCVREALVDEVITDAEDAAIEATLLAAEADIAAVRAARAQHRARAKAA